MCTCELAHTVHTCIICVFSHTHACVPLHAGCRGKKSPGAKLQAEDLGPRGGQLCQASLSHSVPTGYGSERSRTPPLGICAYQNSAEVSILPMEEGKVEAKVLVSVGE